MLPAPPNFLLLGGKREKKKGFLLNPLLFLLLLHRHSTVWPPWLTATYWWSVSIIKRLFWEVGGGVCLTWSEASRAVADSELHKQSKCLCVRTPVCMVHARTLAMMLLWGPKGGVLRTSWGHFSSQQYHLSFHFRANSQSKAEVWSAEAASERETNRCEWWGSFWTNFLIILIDCRAAVAQHDDHVTKQH